MPIKKSEKLCLDKILNFSGHSECINKGGKTEDIPLRNCMKIGAKEASQRDLDARLSMPPMKIHLQNFHFPRGEIDRFSAPQFLRRNSSNGRFALLTSLALPNP